MSKFQKEHRYLVLKNKDMDALSVEQRKQLDNILRTITIGRLERGKGVLECVVVESDWPEHALVLGLLQYSAALESKT